MKLHIFAIKDLAADVFMTPYFHPNVGAVVRSFGDEVNRDDPQNMLNKHPEHFVLYELGTFDDNTGEFRATQPKQLALATDYRKPDPQNLTVERARDLTASLARNGAM